MFIGVIELLDIAKIPSIVEGWTHSPRIIDIPEKGGHWPCGTGGAKERESEKEHGPRWPKKCKPEEGKKPQKPKVNVWDTCGILGSHQSNHLMRGAVAVLLSPAGLKTAYELLGGLPLCCRSIGVLQLYQWGIHLIAS